MMEAGDPDLSGVDWARLLYDDLHRPSDLAELVGGWLIYQHWAAAHDYQGLDAAPHWWAWEAAHSLAVYYPPQALAFIAAVLSQPAAEPLRGILAAGVIEDLLANHGTAVIDEVERLARREPLFRDTLLGVWQNAMTEDVWERVIRARGTDKQR